MSAVPTATNAPTVESGVSLNERTTRLMHRVWSWRVWWCPAIPGESVYFECPTSDDAVRLLNSLALYDLWLTDKELTPDWSNAGGVQRWNPTPTRENRRRGEWEDVEWDDDLKEWL